MGEHRSQLEILESVATARTVVSPICLKDVSIILAIAQTLQCVICLFIMISSVSITVLHPAMK